LFLVYFWRHCLCHHDAHVCSFVFVGVAFPSRHTSLLVSILGGIVFAIMTHMFVHLFVKPLCLFVFLLPLPLPSPMIGDLNGLFG
jgi:hypothetical protein